MTTLCHFIGAGLLPVAGFTGLLGLSLLRVAPLRACATCVIASLMFGASCALLSL